MLQTRSRFCWRPGARLSRNSTRAAPGAPAPARGDRAAAAGSAAIEQTRKYIKNSSRPRARASSSRRGTIARRSIRSTW